MNQYYKVLIKIAGEDNKGRVKYRKEGYIVFAISPTDVEKKMADHLGTEDYEIVSIATANIVDIVK